jgi:urea transport system ATP-binding protein
VPPVANIMFGDRDGGSRVPSRSALLRKFTSPMIRHCSVAGRARDLDEALALFPTLRRLLGRKGGVLSGGEQQMLAIGRALLTRPKLLMFDEPTEGIQPSIVLEIEEAIRRIRSELGLAVLLVEQYLDFAERLADAYVIMAKGAVVAGGPTAQLRLETVRHHLAV